MLLQMRGRKYQVKLVYEFLRVDGSHLLQAIDVSQAPHRQKRQHLTSQEMRS